MKKIFVLSLATMLFSSCLTIKRIERNCDKFAAICVTEKETVTVYRDSTIYRTDTIRVPLPYQDTVKITDTVRIVNNLAYLPTIHKRFGLIGVDAGVNRSVIDVNAYLTDSTILHTHRDTILLEKVIKEESVTQTVPVKHIPGMYRFAFWALLAQLVVLAAWFLKKKYF